MSRVRKEELAEGVTLYLGDCYDALPMLAPSNLVVTSPPYDRQREYTKKIEDWRALMSGAFRSMPTCNYAQIFVNLGLVYQNGEVTQYWQPFIEDMRIDGWRFFGWYAWDQGPGLAGNWKGRLAPSHEWIFHFNKAAIEPNKIVPCLHAGVRKVRGPKSDLRNADGKNAAWSSGATATVTSSHKIMDSVLRVGRQRYSGGAPESRHPAVFPIDLPRALIESYSKPGDIVLDQFMGSGTTGVAAVRLGRHFQGIEREPQYFEIACRRIGDALKQTDLFIKKPAAAAKDGTHV